MKSIIQKVKKQLSQGDLSNILLKAAFGSMGMKLAYTGIAFINGVILAKMLGPAGFGIYSFVISLVMFLTIPSQLGIPTLAMREIATTNAHKDWPHMRGFINRSHQAIGFFTCALVSISLVLLYFLGHKLDPIKLHTMLWGLILVPVISLGSLRCGMMLGLRQVILGQAPEQIVKPGVFMLLLAAMYFFYNEHASATIVMIMQIIATLSAFICGLYFFLHKRPAEVTTAVPQYKTAQWLKSIIPLGMTAALQLINGQTDILVLGIFSTDSNVGIYRVAVQIATLVTFGLQIINAVQAPHIAHLYAIGDKANLQKMITSTSKTILATTVPIVLTIVILGKLIISIAFGEEYITAYIPLIILCLGQLVNASMGSVASLLNMTGHERDTTKGIAMGASINIILNFSLIPVAGMIGAAIATSITLIVWNLMLWHKVYLRLGIESFAFYRHKN